MLVLNMKIYAQTSFFILKIHFILYYIIPLIIINDNYSVK